MSGTDDVIEFVAEKLNQRRHDELILALKKAACDPTPKWIETADAGTMTIHERFAERALSTPPAPNQYVGIAYDVASKRAVAICAAASKAGRLSSSALLHLEQCRMIMDKRSEAQ